MTIIHITSTLGGGGAEKMVLQLAKQSQMVDCKTIVVALSGNTKTTIEEHFINDNIEYHILNVISFKNSSLIKGLKQFKSITKNLDSHVIHCHMFSSALFGMLHKLRHPRTKLIFTLHSNILENRSQRFVLFATKFLRFRDIIFSKKGRKWYLKSKYEIIANGVDFKEFDFGNRTHPKDKFKFLFIGRISHEKSPLRLVKAAQQLIAQNIHNFEIHFVGDGVLKEKLSNEIKTHKLDNYFNLHGFQQDITPFLKETNCLVLPSLWEGLPVVIIEAAASRLPIISTPVGSIPDFLNNANAYLSSLENFDFTMLKVMQNYDEAIKKSEEFYEEIKTTFEIENIFKKHLKLYKLSLK